MMPDDDASVFTLILVRHAEAGTPQAYARHRPGRPDHERPLTAEGRRQAQQVADILDTIGPRPGVILSSSWRRALQTAEPLARGAGLPVQTTFEGFVTPGDGESGHDTAFDIWDPPLDPAQVRQALCDLARRRDLCGSATALQSDSSHGAPESRARRGIFLFGHEPDLSDLVARWLGFAGTKSAVHARFDKATVCRLRVPCDMVGPATQAYWPGAELTALLPLEVAQVLSESALVSRAWAR